MSLRSSQRRLGRCTFWLPGIINPGCVGFIGSGVVLHIPSFFAELDALQSKGVLCVTFTSQSLTIDRTRLHESDIYIRSRPTGFRLSPNRGRSEGSRTRFIEVSPPSGCHDRPHSKIALASGPRRRGLVRPTPERLLDRVFVSTICSTTGASPRNSARSLKGGLNAMVISSMIPKAKLSATRCVVSQTRMMSSSSQKAARDWRNAWNLLSRMVSGSSTTG